MEETAQDGVGPFLSLPPFTSLFFVIIDGGRGDSKGRVRELEVHDGEKELTPRNKGRSSLLVGREADGDAGFVSFEDEMKHGGYFLGGGGRLLNHLVGDVDESREECFNDFGKAVIVLTESKVERSQ